MGGFQLILAELWWAQAVEEVVKPGCRQYFTGDLTETLGYRSKRYNSADFYAKFNTSAQVLTGANLLRAC